MLCSMSLTETEMETFDEYKTYIKAGNFPEDAAKATFTLLDKDKCGKIDRKEYISFLSSFAFIWMIRRCKECLEVNVTRKLRYTYWCSVVAIAAYK